MHPANTARQNEQLTELLNRIHSSFRAAARRPNRDRARLSESFAEVWWRGNNERFRDVIGILRHAERAFQRVITAVSVDDAMAAFTVRPEKPPRWEAMVIPAGNAIPARLPAGAIVLVPAQRGARQCCFKLAA